MLNLFQYTVPYWAVLSSGVVATMINRIARLFPALLIAAAIGLVPNGPIPASQVSARLSLLYYLGVLTVLAYVTQSFCQFLSRH